MVGRGDGRPGAGADWELQRVVGTGPSRGEVGGGMGRDGGGGREGGGMRRTEAGWDLGSRVSVVAATVSTVCTKVRRPGKLRQFGNFISRFVEQRQAIIQSRSRPSASLLQREKSAPSSSAHSLCASHHPLLNSLPTVHSSVT